MNIKEVDIIAHDKDTNSVCLVVMDELNWDDIDLHLSTLQDKLLYYVNYIESKEIEKRYYSMKDLAVSIKVVFENSPPPEGERFINQAMLILEETGYVLSYCNYNEDA